MLDAHLHTEIDGLNTPFSYPSPFAFARIALRHVKV